MGYLRSVSQQTPIEFVIAIDPNAEKLRELSLLFQNSRFEILEALDLQAARAWLHTLASMDFEAQSVCICIPGTPPECVAGLGLPLVTPLDLFRTI